MRLNKNLHLFQKIFLQNVEYNKNIKNIVLRVLYNHKDHNFRINLLANENVKNVDDGKSQCDKTYSTNSEECEYSIDKHTFTKNVLKHYMFPVPNQNLPPKKIVIDFSSPNIAKPFHMGHLRSTIIGNFIANINTHFNNNVTKINYLGDWGTQFGLLQYGLQAKNIDLMKTQSPIKTLFEAYVYANKLALSDKTVMQKARKYFSDIENGKTSLDNWKQIRTTTVQELEEVYRRLGIKFDAYHWESDYNGSAITHLMNSLENRNIIKTDDEGKKVAVVKDRLVTVLKSDSSTLYLARDIAALLDRYKKYDFDKMLYVVDNAQTDHFTAVIDVVRQINKKCAENCEHVKFGRIKGMSTRAGNVVFLNDILNEAKHKMHNKQMQSKNTKATAMNEETCDILAATAVIINDLKQKRMKDYVFNWDKALQSEGDSGIKLQYLHCRLWSLEKNCGVSIPDVCQPEHLPEEVVGEVVAELAKFEHVLLRSLEEHEAHILVGYLFKLARHVNKMFKELRVKNVEVEVAAQRLLVFRSARLVVKTSLEILGVKPLYEM